MADVTVNIQGDSSRFKPDDGNQGGGRLAPQQPQPDNGNQGGSRGAADSGRMIDDVRREMQQRGVLMVPGSQTVSQIVNTYAQSQRDETNKRITSKYDERRQSISKRRDKAYDGVDEEIADLSASEMSRLKEQGADKDPLHISQMQQRVETNRNRLMKNVSQRFDDEEEGISKAENEELKQADKELTDAIKELTEYFSRQKGDESDSHIGKLREQQKVLINERDTATNEQEAISASKRLAEVNKDLSRAMGKDGERGSDPLSLKGLQMGQGVMGMAGALQTGSWQGAMMSGAVMTGNPYAMAGAALVAGGSAIVSNSADTSESQGRLAAMRSTVPGLTGTNAREGMWGVMQGESTQGGRRYTDLGFDIESFADEAVNRIKSRGSSDNWYENTYQQISLERSLSMDSGALQSGSQYDRYGTNVTEAVSQLISKLNSVGVAGANYGDFSRVQEKYDIQQSVMGSYMGRSDKPDYSVANQMLAGFSGVEGITQDRRMGSDIQQMQNMVQNPMNDRMKALIHSTVQDLFPETAGRADLIDRAIRDPKNEGQLIQAVIERVTKMYGGTDTQMGYFAVKQILGGMAPERADAYVEQFSDPDSRASRILTQDESEDSKAVARQNMDTWVREGSGLSTTKNTVYLKEISDNFSALMGIIGGFKSTPIPSQPKPGK